MWCMSSSTKTPGTAISGLGSSPVSGVRIRTTRLEPSWANVRFRRNRPSEIELICVNLFACLVPSHVKLAAISEGILVRRMMR